MTADERAFALAEKGRLNFLLGENGIKTQVLFESAEVALFRLATSVFKNKKIVIVTTDSAYFAAAKAVKDFLICNLGEQSILCFCADDGGVASPAFISALNSQSLSESCLVAVGGGDVVRVCKYIAGRKKVPAVAVPIGCDVGDCFFVAARQGGLFSGDECDYDLSAVVIDENLMLKTMKKQRLLASLKRVRSLNILKVENQVKRLICGFFDENSFKKHEYFLNIANTFADKYFISRELVFLTFAEIYGALADRFSPAPNAARIMARLCGADGESFAGEREYKAYCLLLALYGYYLNGDFAFCNCVPSLTLPAEIAEGVFKIPFSRLNANLPECIFDAEKINGYKNALSEEENVSAEIKNQTAELKKQAADFKSVYAGRKRAHDLISQKKWREVLSVAPLAVKGECLLKLIWAHGVLDGLSDL